MSATLDTSEPKIICGTDTAMLTAGKDPSLTPYEQLLYSQLAEEMRAGKTDVLNEASVRDYVRQPPSMEEFLLDDYYLGRTWRAVPGENEGLFPEWQRILSTHLNFDSRIHNLVLTGSLGVGKTSLMVTILLYRICLATFLKNPQNFFGLNRGSPILYNLLSVTKEAVRDTAFGFAMTYMSDSPYFTEVCKYDPDSDYSAYRIPMLNTLPDGSESRLWLTGGSKGQHVLGRNLVGIGMDEGNFRLEKDPDLTAYTLYDQVRTRIANRFQKISAYLPAISIIASSALDESSFTEKVCEEIAEANRKREEENAKIKDEEAKQEITQLVVRNAIYRIKRHVLTGIGPDHLWFKVAYGLRNMEPFILSGKYREDGTPVGEEKHEEPPPGARVELVPTFYLDAYRRNVKSQLQNLSGISVGGSHRLFTSTIDIEHCLETSKAEGVPDPMLPGVARIPVSSEDNKQIWDYLNHKAFLARVASRVQPMRHPQNKRYVHLDLATRNLAGFGMCHLAGMQRVDGLVKDGLPFSEYRLIVEYDFILTICAGQYKPINFEKITNFIFWLRDYCGYRFGKVTADQYQSVSPLQTLEARGFEVGDLSIDRNKDVYTAWRTGFEEQRIRLYRNEQMIKEAAELIELDKKFDKPDENGSKDTSDGAAGSYYDAITSDEKVSLLAHNAPVLETGKQRDPNSGMLAPIMNIPLPEKGYDRKRKFTV